MSYTPPTPQQSRRWARIFLWTFLILLATSGGVLALLIRYAPNRPVKYADPLEHFYYGSYGSDMDNGLPYRIVIALPRLFPEYMPSNTNRDLSAFGFIQQPGHPLPIGFSMRRQVIDLVGINCAACHTGLVEIEPDTTPLIVPGMPANTLDLQAFFEFLFTCAGDWRFRPEYLIPEMEKDGKLNPVDKLIYSELAIPVFQGALLARKTKLAVLVEQGHPRFGPGRVDTFNSFKFDQFAYWYHGHEIVSNEVYGIVDFPSIWNQTQREGLWLHWDGNNNSVFERNFSAAFASGATPAKIDIKSLERIDAWLDTLPAPKYPFPIDEQKAERGKAIYRRLCYDCHDFGGTRVGKVVDIEDIGTDPYRMYSYTGFLLKAQQAYTDGYPFKFNHFRKTNGYANHPLDGIWARAPYLHNGSVPSMWDLLQPESARPIAYARGPISYDQQRMGFTHEVLTPDDERYITVKGDPYTGDAWIFDTRRIGDSNEGHTGPVYGTDLSETDKEALIEYLKTL